MKTTYRSLPWPRLSILVCSCLCDLVAVNENTRRAGNRVRPGGPRGPVLPNSLGTPGTATYKLVILSKSGALSECQSCHLTGDSRTSMLPASQGSCPVAP